MQYDEIRLSTPTQLCVVLLSLFLVPASAEDRPQNSQKGSAGPGSAAVPRDFQSPERQPAVGKPAMRIGSIEGVNPMRDGAGGMLSIEPLYKGKAVRLYADEALTQEQAVSRQLDFPLSAIEETGKAFRVRVDGAYYWVSRLETKKAIRLDATCQTANRSVSATAAARAANEGCATGGRP